MSTYNGEKYLREQIDSITAQKGVEFQIVVRDDGSTDSTIQILSEYAEKRLLTFYSDGENLGPQLSFMRMLQLAPESDYYAFSDQDDYWQPDKLACALQMLEADKDSKGLYFSQTRLVDKNLKDLKQIPIHPYCTFGESLIYKFIGGCTMVFTHSVRKAVNQSTPKFMPMHDIWIYGVAQAIGTNIHFDPVPHILYRQHGNNAVGQGHNALYELKGELKRFFGHVHERWQNAHDIQKAYFSQMPTENQQLLQLFISGRYKFINRLRIIMSKELRCSSKKTQVLFWINVLCNNY